MENKRKVEEDHHSILLFYHDNQFLPVENYNRKDEIEKILEEPFFRIGAIWGQLPSFPLGMKQQIGDFQTSLLPPPIR